MSTSREYSGKVTLNYNTRSEQLAIDKLCELLDAAPIEDVVFILDGYDAYQAAKDDPNWSVNQEARAIQAGLNAGMNYGEALYQAQKWRREKA